MIRARSRNQSARVVGVDVGSSRIDEYYIIGDIGRSKEQIWIGPRGGRKQGREKLAYALALH
jgi:hypothetical protein